MIRDYCREAGPRGNLLLQALVLIDFECRLKAGQTRRAEDYLREFPQLHSHKEVILNLLQIEARWNIGEPPASNSTGVEGLRENPANDVDGKSSGVAVETAASGADLSVIAPTRTSPGDGFSAPNFSGETVSAQEPPSVTGLPVPLELGKFKLIEVVGQGGFGTVYRGIDTELGRDVAVKFPEKEMLGSGNERERFIREAQRRRSPPSEPCPDLRGRRDARAALYRFGVCSGLYAEQGACRKEFWNARGGKNRP